MYKVRISFLQCIKSGPIVFTVYQVRVSFLQCIKSGPVLLQCIKLVFTVYICCPAWSLNRSPTMLLNYGLAEALIWTYRIYVDSWVLDPQDVAHFLCLKTTWPETRPAHPETDFYVSCQKELEGSTVYNACVRWAINKRLDSHIFFLLPILSQCFSCSLLLYSRSF